MLIKKLPLGITLLVGLPMTTAAASDGETANSGGSLVEMEAIAVPIVDGSRVEGTLHFRIVLQASEGAIAERLSANLPMLRAEALVAGSEFSRLSASPFLAVDAARLASELTAALQTREPDLDRVLLVEVVAKP